MPYYPTLKEDLARAKQILEEGKAWRGEVVSLFKGVGDDPERIARLEDALGGTIFGKDIYAAYKLLESFVNEIEHPDHYHCECRTSGCGHIDLRHERGKCSFPGCNCEGWA